MLNRPSRNCDPLAIADCVQISEANTSIWNRGRSQTLRDVATADMREATSKVAGLALNGR